MSKITKKALLARIEALEKENKQRGIGNQFMTLKCIQGNRHFTKDTTYCASKLFDRTVITTNFGTRKTLEENTNIFGGYKVTGENQTAVFQVIGAEADLKLKQIDQSVFNGLDEKWRFAAVDEDSRAFKFDCEPAINCDEWYEGHGQKKVLIGTGYDTTNWKNSLIERESKELTGKELVGAMLDNGKNKVLVRVSSTSDKDIERMILAFARKQDGEIVTNNGNTWDFMIAIDADDKPLTAKEAGL